MNRRNFTEESITINGVEVRWVGDGTRGARTIEGIEYIPATLIEGPNGPSRTNYKFNCNTIDEAKQILLEINNNSGRLYVATFNTRMNSLYLHHGIEGQNYVFKDENNKRKVGSTCHRWHITLRENDEEQIVLQPRSSISFTQ
jgi:hypothetical protein